MGLCVCVCTCAVGHVEQHKATLWHVSNVSGVCAGLRRVGRRVFGIPLRRWGPEGLGGRVVLEDPRKTGADESLVNTEKTRHRHGVHVDVLSRTGIQ